MPSISPRPRHTGRLDLHLEKQLQGADGPFRLQASVSLERGQCLALLGPSGSGKTTLIRLLAGLAKADAGYIDVFGSTWLDCQTRIDLPARRRRAGMVFQDYALFPNMTVRGNLRFALPRGRPAAQADRLLEMVGLNALAGRRPGQLSGGQQQRLALARALAAEPELLLLDEPLSALDSALRRDLQDELIALRERRGLTMIVVTHDMGEALRLADRALQMQAGKVLADSSPAELLGSAGEIRLAGQVLGEDPASPGHYLIEVQGRLCRARVLPGSALQPGSRVSVEGGDWLARPLEPREPAAQ